jgi:hypothetical protein
MTLKKYPNNDIIDIGVGCQRSEIPNVWVFYRNLNGGILGPGTLKLRKRLFNER